MTVKERKLSIQKRGQIRETSTQKDEINNDSYKKRGRPKKQLKLYDSLSIKKEKPGVKVEIEEDKKEQNEMKQKQKDSDAAARIELEYKESEDEIGEKEDEEEVEEEEEIFNMRMVLKDLNKIEKALTKYLQFKKIK